MSAPTESRAFATIAYEVADAIATITLDRPEQLNALDPTMERELLAVWDLVDADDAVRAVVVTGRGRAFCAGADLSDAGDVEAMVGAVTEAMVDELAVAGTPADVEEQLRRFDGVVDEVVLSPPTFRVAPERVAENLATLIEHCAPQ